MQYEITGDKAEKVSSNITKFAREVLDIPPDRFIVSPTVGVKGYSFYRIIPHQFISTREGDDYIEIDELEGNDGFPLIVISYHGNTPLLDRPEGPIKRLISLFEEYIEK